MARENDPIESDFKSIYFKTDQIRFKSGERQISSLANRKLRPPIEFPNLLSDDSSNSEIYERILRHKIDQSFDGKNITILTYGISGSGKTHTIFGLSPEAQRERTK